MLCLRALQFLENYCLTSFDLALNARRIKNRSDHSFRAHQFTVNTPLTVSTTETQLLPSPAAVHTTTTTPIRSVLVRQNERRHTIHSLEATDKLQRGVCSWSLIQPSHSHPSLQPKELKVTFYQLNHVPIQQHGTPSHRRWRRPRRRRRPLRQ